MNKEEAFQTQKVATTEAEINQALTVGGKPNVGAQELLTFVKGIHEINMKVDKLKAAEAQLEEVYQNDYRISYPDLER